MFGEIVVTAGYVVEGSVRVGVEYGIIVCYRKIVVSVMFWDIVGNSWSCMVGFGGWKGKWALCGIVRMDFG